MLQTRRSEQEKALSLRTPRLPLSRAANQIGPRFDANRLQIGDELAIDIAPGVETNANGRIALSVERYVGCPTNERIILDGMNARCADRTFTDVHPIDDVHSLVELLVDVEQTIIEVHKMIDQRLRKIDAMRLIMVQPVRPDGGTVERQTG